MELFEVYFLESFDPLLDRLVPTWEHIHNVDASAHVGFT